MKLFFTNRFYYIGLALVGGFILGFYFPNVFFLCKILAGVFLFVVVADLLALFYRGSASAMRHCGERFSNGDENEVSLLVQSEYAHPVSITVLDELPEQFQIRDFEVTMNLAKHESKALSYKLKPVERGEYGFGYVILLIQSRLGLIVRRIKSATPEIVKVYPSFLRLHQYELMAISSHLTLSGQKQIRKVGNSREFDTIREYVAGDDPRKINWAATARRGHLMTNHYTDERSQNVYCLIDKSRTMRMPFEGMTLLDYAINASLVIADIAMKKGDQAGLLTFEHKVDTFLKASHHPGQMHQVMERLYHIETSFREPDFEALHNSTARNINQRSLLLLFTNYESVHSLRRQLPYLKLMSRKHLVLLVYFRNTEVDQILKDEARNTREIYDQSIARQMLDEKLLIGDELKRAGILSLYTTPQSLNVDVINRYIEIKTRRML